MRNQSILFVEDEEAIHDMVRFALEPSGFILIEAANTKAAEIQLAQIIPDLILLDWMLPGMTGIDFARKLKRQQTTKHIPIIILTAKAQEENKIEGLERGADDYITKPFSVRELLARIKAMLRRNPLVSAENIIESAKLKLNVDTYQVTIADQLITLTPNEYKLLYFFLTHQNKVYTRSELLDHIWGKNCTINERTVDVLVRRVRKRLKIHNYDQSIKTMQGVGYQFVTNN